MKKAKFFIYSIAFILTLTVSSLAIKAAEVNPIGIWEGKWDNKWSVRFTISKGKAEAYDVIYEWEENKGEPMSKGSGEATFKDGVLHYKTLIDIKFKDDTTATATGKFANPRTAELKKQKKEEKKEKEENKVK